MLSVHCGNNAWTVTKFRNVGQISQRSVPTEKHDQYAKPISLMLEAHLIGFSLKLVVFNSNPVFDVVSLFSVSSSKSRTFTSKYQIDL